MRGTETSATAGEKHRSAALPWGLAQQGALDLLVQLPAGGRLLVSAAFTLTGLQEALGVLHAWFLPFAPICVSPSSASLVWAPDLP